MFKIIIKKLTTEKTGVLKGAILGPSVFEVS